MIKVLFFFIMVECGFFIVYYVFDVLGVWCVIVPWVVIQWFKGRGVESSSGLWWM